MVFLCNKWCCPDLKWKCNAESNGLWQKSWMWTVSCKLVIYNTRHSEGCYCIIFEWFEWSQPSSHLWFVCFLCHGLHPLLRYIVWFLLFFSFFLSWPGWRKETQERCFFSNCVLITQGLFTSPHLMVSVETMLWRRMLMTIMDKGNWNPISELDSKPRLLTLSKLLKLYVWGAALFSFIWACRR